MHEISSALKYQLTSFAERQTAKKARNLTTKGAKIKKRREEEA
jgi:hypothetical protein